MTVLQDIQKRDLASAYKEAGVPVSCGTFSSYGILLNEALEVLQMGSKLFAVQDTTKTLSIVTGSLGVLKNHTPITVDGVAFQIDKFIPIGNGQETKLWVMA
jgi:hypothetical protein